MYWIISRASAVSGSDLRSADAGRDENGQPDVNFTLTGDGGRRFAAFTGSHVGDKLAVFPSWVLTGAISPLRFRQAR